MAVLPGCWFTWYCRPGPQKARWRISCQSWMVS